MNNSFDTFKTILSKIFEETFVKMLEEPLEKKPRSITNLMFPSRDISQHRVTIVMGNVFEKAFNELAKTCGAKAIEYEDITKPQMVNGHKMDTLFEYKNCIYYYENKTGVGVDTEKAEKTYQKIKNMKKYLCEKYSSKEVISKILTATFPIGAMATNCKKPISTDNIIGYREFFSIFDIKDVDDDNWVQLLKVMGKKVEDILGDRFC